VLVSELDKVQIHSTTSLKTSSQTSSETLVVPIPIHSARRRERGYNQAELIARGVADALGLPMVDVLRRTRYTGTQTALSEQQRLVNLTNAFVVHRPAMIRNTRILLVDDVLTTGATLNTAAEALLMAGARRVDALTIGATI
jgi:ComF family protein